MNNVRLLVVSAHAADFVWRAGGAIATVTRNSGTAQVVALSYSERGESGELWKEPGQTERRVKEIRRSEAEPAANILVATFVPFDLGAINYTGYRSFCGPWWAQQIRPEPQRPCARVSPPDRG